MSRLRRLEALSRLLQGQSAAGADWMAVLELANQALVTPQLYAAALRSGAAADLPEDVAAYLHEIWRRNRLRNRRLHAQLTEAVTSLNAAGVEPILLKGAARGAVQGRPLDHDRLQTDLDLLVAPEQVEEGVRALQAAGFAVHARYPERAHVAAELCRPHDVGLIDLHRRPPGPAGLTERMLTDGDLWQPVSWDGARAVAPRAELQIYLLTLHDQFHEGGYWRGGFVLRHLLDIAMMAREPGGVDWERVYALSPTRLGRHALAAQLLAAQELCGAPATGPAAAFWTRLQHARLRAQFDRPRLSPALAGLGLVSELPTLVAHRRSARRQQASTGDGAPRLSFEARCRRFVRELLAEPASGRI